MKCNWCGKEKEGVETGICNHCGRFGKPSKTIAQQPQPKSVTGSVPHRSCKGCLEYGLDRDCSGKCP